MLGFKNKTSETADAEKDAAKKNPKPKRSRFVKLLTILAVAVLCIIRPWYTGKKYMRKRKNQLVKPTVTITATDN